MRRAALALALLLAVPAAAQQLAPQGGTPVYNRRALYAGPDNGAIATANVAVTVFGANTVVNGCDIVNTGAATLYVDFVTTAAAGSATSLPIPPGWSWHCPFPPLGAVTAVAGAAQGFSAVRY